MRDSMGGSVVITIIVVFIVVALAYLAFNVNYTKAFRMKNKIISYYEDFNGNCDSACHGKIKEYADAIGYKPDTLNCPGSYNQKEGLYCVKEVLVSGGGTVDPSRPNDQGKRTYYRIITKINIEIPIISNVFDLSVFNISGDTKVMKN